MINGSYAYDWLYLRKELIGRGLSYVIIWNWRVRSGRDFFARHSRNNFSVFFLQIIFVDLDGVD